MLVGRQAQQTALTPSLDNDTPTVLVGEAGIGKTSLLRWAVAAEGAGGDQVLDLGRGVEPGEPGGRKGEFVEVNHEGQRPVATGEVAQR